MLVFIHIFITNRYMILKRIWILSAVLELPPVYMRGLLVKKYARDISVPVFILLYQEKVTETDSHYTDG